MNATGFWLVGLLFLCSMGVCVLMLVRNDLVYRARTKRHDTVARWNRLAIAHKLFTLILDYNHDRSYTAMHWDFRCWTYRQFFPEPVMDPGIAALHGIDWEEP